MPLKDKKRLEYFFRDVCFLHEWAYTLMGSKPMSIYDYVKPWAAIRRVILHSGIKDILHQTFCPPRFHLICYLFNPEQLKLKLGWETLNKYIQQFPDSRFVLFSYPNSGDRVCLALLDKVKIINVVKRNLSDFREVLESLSIEPEELSKNEKLYSFIFNLNNDCLIGSVLGFGRDNACLFDKYNKMNLDQWPLTSPWPDEESVNLEKLNQKEITFQPWDLSDLFYPQFACDPDSEETKQLRQTYRQEREEIIKYYEGKDVVEATLSLLNQK